MRFSAGKRAIRFAAAAMALAVGTVGLASPASAAIPGPAEVTSAPWTPQLATSGTDGSIEQVRQLVQCGATMYAVGSFSAVKKAGVTHTRNNAFSFSATNGAVTGWNPNVNGRVESVALSADCSTAYLGGSFTAVNGTPVKNIAAVDTLTGAVKPAYWSVSSAGGMVHTLVLAKGHLLVGGRFTSINGSTKDYLVSLNPSTGRDDNYLNLNISGNYKYTDDGGRQSRGNVTQVFNTTLSPDGNKLLAMGVFTSIDGQPRRQIFMLDLGTTATVNPWYSPDFDQNCHIVEPFYLQDASWAPDMSKIYVATTGYKAANGTGYRTSDPRGDLTPGAVSNICDAAAAYPTTAISDVRHDWVNYTGCDSLYSTAADANHVYIGGHQRWADSPLGCDGAGIQGVSAPGMGGLDPSTGALDYNPTKGRGLGATDMLRTSAGLWIASDNQANVSQCAGESARMGICFLPADQLLP